MQTRRSSCSFSRSANLAFSFASCSSNSLILTACFSFTAGGCEDFLAASASAAANLLFKSDTCSSNDALSVAADVSSFLIKSSLDFYNEMLNHDLILEYSSAWLTKVCKEDSNSDTFDSKDLIWFDCSSIVFLYFWITSSDTTGLAGAGESAMPCY